MSGINHGYCVLCQAVLGGISSIAKDCFGRYLTLTPVYAIIQIVRNRTICIRLFRRVIT